MFLDLRQKQVLTHKLIMTPQLQQAIKLLQLSRVELVETVRQELAENPALEEAAGSKAEDGIEAALARIRRAAVSQVKEK